MNGKPKYVVMFGVDTERKARAAKFNINDEAVVRKAAGLMNYRVGLAKTDAAAALVAKLPDGKLYDSGLGMAPLVSEDTFYKLFALLTFDANWTTTGLITGSKSNADAATLKAANDLWGTIKAGSVVLAFELTEPDIFGWGAAIVVSVSKNGESLELRWRDWPGYKPFTAERRNVALLRPDAGG